MSMISPSGAILPSSTTLRLSFYSLVSCDDCSFKFSSIDITSSSAIFSCISKSVAENLQSCKLGMRKSYRPV
ncbi:hypothetical protein [uncultured Methanobrevibacter sp.]|uniref:hypothetical protein n=1 Tax=uncultured Methanobrevibacter sp. TaxID=253161 RepID=UPI0025DBDB02|nr:hypothetical protein [uncultured Methanobrevibacter sp.]